MVITTTAVAFVLLSVGLAFVGWRFLKAFRETDSARTDRKSGFLLGLFFLASALHNGILGVGALFFARNPEGLSAVFIVAYFFLVLFAVFGVYALHYIFWPHTSFNLAVIITGILGIIGAVLIFVTPARPFTTSQNSVDWNIPFPLSFITFCLFLIALAAAFYIFIQLFFRSEAREIQILSLIISLLALVGIINVFTRLVLLYGAPAAFRSRILDIGVGLTGIGFIIFLIVAPLIKNYLRSGEK